MAGVLHRDISAGNVLISEDGPGFLLDFDYSEFTEDGLARFKSLHPDSHLEEIDKDMEDITASGSLLLHAQTFSTSHREHIRLCLSSRSFT
jgi:serine/threonine protein kinase